jgi:hypothetical protein
MDEDRAAAGAGWELWRQDDKGNRFLIVRRTGSPLSPHRDRVR